MSFLPNASKRRRVLSDIVNSTLPMVDSSRRKSLGFDLARIEHNIPPSSIPEPPSDSTKVIKEKAIQNRAGSAIPTMSRAHSYSKYLQVSKSLSEKCKVNSAGFEAPFDDKPDSESFEKLEELTSLRKKLSREVAEANRTLETLKKESKELERTHKRLRRQTLEKETQIRLLAAQFEAKEQKVQENVAHEAQMTDLRLREHENKLLNDYNEAKFKLETEIAENTEYNDPETTKAIEELEAQKSQLEKELEEAISRKEEAINLEMALMEAEVDETLKQKTIEVDKASAQFQEKQSALEQLLNQCDALSKDVQQKQDEKTELENQVEEMEQQINGFDVLKLLLKQELALLNDDMLAVQGEDLDWHKKVEEEQQKFLEVKRKHDMYSNTRRYLEHTIMSHESTLRRFVRIENSIALVRGSEVHLGNDGYRFEKAGFLQIDPDYPLEWKLLVEEALLHSNVSLLFCGSDKKPSMHNVQTVFRFLKQAEQAQNDWSFKISLQSIGFSKNEIFDMLNSSTDTSIEYAKGTLSVISQRMLVQNMKDISLAAKNIDSYETAIYHLFTIDGENIRTHSKSVKYLSIMNLTQLPTSDQIQVLLETTSEPGQLARHLMTETKCLCACDISHGDANEVKPFLQTIEALK